MLGGAYGLLRSTIIENWEHSTVFSNTRNFAIEIVLVQSEYRNNSTKYGLSHPNVTADRKFTNRNFIQERKLQCSENKKVSVTVCSAK